MRFLSARLPVGTPGLFLCLLLLLASLSLSSARFTSDPDQKLPDDAIEEEDEWVAYPAEIVKRDGQMRLEDLWHKHIWRTVAGVVVELMMLAVILGVCMGVSTRIGALFLFVVFTLHVVVFFFVLLHLRIVDPVTALGQPWGDVY
jgi:hypothetical protein